MVIFSVDYKGLMACLHDDNRGVSCWVAQRGCLHVGGLPGREIGAVTIP